MTGRSYLDTLASPVTLLGLTDVTNPYHGPQGFAAVFGPQKVGVLVKLKKLIKLQVTLLKSFTKQPLIYRQYQEVEQLED